MAIGWRAAVLIGLAALLLYGSAGAYWWQRLHGAPGHGTTGCERPDQPPR